MNILVTGSTGFIGSHLCRALLEKKHRVLAFHRAESDVSQLKNLAIEHMIGDITQPGTLYKAMKGVDVVFHAAAQLRTPKKFRDWIAVTVTGTTNVMHAALQFNVRRVVHTSSVAALGVPDRLGSLDLMDEQHTWNYQALFWPYACSKYLAELEVQKAVGWGLDAVIVNPGEVLGAGNLYRPDSVIVQVACRKLPLVTQGGLNIVHIDDVVQGHLAALERGNTGERYILGGENMTLAEYLRKIATVAKVPAPKLMLPAGLARLIGGLLHRSKLKFHGLDVSQLHLAGYYFYYNTAKAKKQLGLTAEHPAAIAIREAYDWYMRCE
jgi:dihydroflavonol-4-reductase